MTETILRDGEVAFTSNGDVIMNVNTLLELKAKLETSEIPTEQTNEEAMENVMLLLALLFGPEILDGPKVSKLQKPVAPSAMPARTPEDDTHPEVGQDLYFPLPLIGDSVSARRTLAESPYVYVDNYGNVFGTMSECDFLHQMSPGTTQKLVSGKQRLGYAFGYKGMICNEKNMKLANHSIYEPYGDRQVRSLFNDKHLVMVVAVRKSDLVVTEVNTRESRYAAWKNAMVQANKLLNKAVEDANSDVRLIGRPEFLSIIDRRRQATKFYRKEYKSKRNMKFPYDD